MVSTEVERQTKVDVADVPSAAWGWSGDAPRLWHILGILMAVFLVAMIRGDHVGRTEDAYLIGFAALILFFVGRDWYLRRKGLTR